MIELAKKLLDKGNVYLLVQYFWLIVTYYLMVNTFFNIGIKMFPNINESIPSKVLSYNTLILGIMKEWTPFVFLLSIVLIISGFIITSAKYLPGIENYRVQYHVDVGVHLGLWLLTIVITYYLYLKSSTIFILVIPFVVLIYDNIKKMVGRYKDRPYKYQ